MDPANLHRIFPVKHTCIEIFDCHVRLPEGNQWSNETPHLQEIEVRNYGPHRNKLQDTQSILEAPTWFPVDFTLKQISEVAATTVIV